MPNWARRLSRAWRMRPKKWFKLQGQGHNVKNNGTHGKVISQGIFMWNIQGLALTVQKLLAKLKFHRGGQNDRMTNRTKTICPPTFNLGGIKKEHMGFICWVNESIFSAINKGYRQQRTGNQKSLLELSAQYFGDFCVFVCGGHAVGSTFFTCGGYAVVSIVFTCGD